MSQKSSDMFELELVRNLRRNDFEAEIGRSLSKMELAVYENGFADGARFGLDRGVRLARGEE